ncbi:unnamed protein product [Chrysoparadoxa australica]
MQLFQRKSSGMDLPMVSGGRRPPRTLRRLQVPKFSVITIISWGWTFGSIFLLIAGWRHCRYNSEATSLRCDLKSCRFQQMASAIVLEDTTFPRENLKPAQTIKVRGGQIVSNSEAARKRGSKSMGTSYSVAWALMGDQGEVLELLSRPMSKRGLGRKAPRQAVAKIKRYISGEIDEVSLEESRWASGLGVVCLVFGSLLLIMRLVIWDLRSDPSAGDYKKRKQPQRGRKKAG